MHTNRSANGLLFTLKNQRNQQEDVLLINCIFYIILLFIALRIKKIFFTQKFDNYDRIVCFNEYILKVFKFWGKFCL